MINIKQILKKRFKFAHQVEIQIIVIRNKLDFHNLVSRIEFPENTLLLFVYLNFFAFHYYNLSFYSIIKVSTCPKSRLDGSSGKTLGYGLDDPDSIPGDGGADFFPLLCVQADPEPHSTFCKISTRAFPVVKTAERRAGHPFFLVPRLWICELFQPHSPWTFVAYIGDTFSFTCPER